MARIEVELCQHDLVLLNEFVRKLGGDATVMDLVAVIVLHSKEMDVLRKADRVEQSLIEGLLDLDLH